ncbi:hypothetical protein BJ742DRAFT_523555 [Cladochytrium replicatum]|nr:hypothetical protein BJ742DRAFT_523555 [Cladochytrium replicatum]
MSTTAGHEIDASSTAGKFSLLQNLPAELVLSLSNNLANDAHRFIFLNSICRRFRNLSSSDPSFFNVVRLHSMSWNRLTLALRSLVPRALAIKHLSIRSITTPRDMNDDSPQTLWPEITSLLSAIISRNLTTLVELRVLWSDFRNSSLSEGYFWSLLFPPSGSIPEFSRLSTVSLCHNIDPPTGRRLERSLHYRDGSPDAHAITQTPDSQSEKPSPTRPTLLFHSSHNIRCLAISNVPLLTVLPAFNSLSTLHLGPSTVVDSSSLTLLIHGPARIATLCLFDVKSLNAHSISWSTAADPSSSLKNLFIRVDSEPPLATHAFPALAKLLPGLVSFAYVVSREAYFQSGVVTW